MKYRIKNPEVEKAVRVLFKTEEIYQSVLNDTCDKHFRDYFSGIVIEGNSTQAKMGLRFSIGIAKKLIEEVIEYDPKGWNEMRVLPPANGQYLVYCKSAKCFSIWHRNDELWQNGGWHIYYDDEDNENLKDFKYRSLDFLKEEGENDNAT